MGFVLPNRVSKFMSLLKSSNTYYEDFRKVYSALLGAALKDATHVTKAFITGCLRVTKESMFTGFNNFSVSSLSTQDLPDLCGFTENEVDGLLKYFNLTNNTII